MFLIADSGSSKTDWLLAADGQQTDRFQTSGLNPLFHDEESVLRELHTNSGLSAIKNSIHQLRFFGAGCSGPEQELNMEKILKKFFSAARIRVDSDLTAAAIATCGTQPGISCILGTGSNACFYDGQNVHKNNFGLGFILADEGGGTYLGKKLLTCYLYELLPQDLRSDFEKQHVISKEIVIFHVYQMPQPNMWLASFAAFLTERKEHPWVRKLVRDMFIEFLELYVCSLVKDRKLAVHFTGSIAFHFREILFEAIEQKKLSAGKIIQRPADELMNFFLQNENRKQ